MNERGGAAGRLVQLSRRPSAPHFDFLISLIASIDIVLSIALHMSYTVSPATPTAVKASISTPVLAVMRAVARMRTVLAARGIDA